MEFKEAYNHLRSYANTTKAISVLEKALEGARDIEIKIKDMENKVDRYTGQIINLESSLTEKRAELKSLVNEVETQRRITIEHVQALLLDVREAEKANEDAMKRLNDKLEQHSQWVRAEISKLDEHITARRREEKMIIDRIERLKRNVGSVETAV